MNTTMRSRLARLETASDPGGRLIVVTAHEDVQPSEVLCDHGVKQRLADLLVFIRKPDPVEPLVRVNGSMVSKIA